MKKMFLPTFLLLISFGVFVNTVHAEELSLAISASQILPTEHFWKNIDIEDDAQVEALKENCQDLAIDLSNLAPDRAFKKDKCSLQKKVLGLVKKDLSKTIQNFPWCRKYGCDEQKMHYLRYEVHSECLKYGLYKRHDYECRNEDSSFYIFVELAYEVNIDRPVDKSEFPARELNCAELAGRDYDQLSEFDQRLWSECDFNKQ